MDGDVTPAASRSQTIQALAHAPLDVLVIGGGIVGAGIARDAAMRGLAVGLVEQHDFAFGTSSRSSRLLHGGLRYLAQGRLGLVREASVEKKIVQHIAPHLAQPMPFVFPSYRGNREWVLWKLKIGVKLYDLLCRGRNFAPSSWLKPDGVLQRIPGLAQTGLRGAVRYYDGFTNDARLVIDTLRSAASHGAHVVNYCRFVDAAAGALWKCSVEDVLDARRFEVKARAVVNATGPWAHGLPHSTVKLRLSKGVHVVLDRARLPVTETVVLTDGDRILFTIPWEERVILGTTDSDYDGPLDRVIAHAEEVEYLLGVANRFFPAARLAAADVISTWAGLRPLIADPRGRPADISRCHEICNPEPGWWDVAGGKLTTYRLMAEQTIDRILKSLPARDRAKPLAPCRTAIEPLLPEQETAGVSGLAPPAFGRAAVEHYCRREWAVHLSDIMVRRTGWHYYFADALDRAETVADWMASILGWTEPMRQAELAHYRAGRAAAV